MICKACCKTATDKKQARHNAAGKPLGTCQVLTCYTQFIQCITSFCRMRLKSSTSGHDRVQNTLSCALKLSMQYYDTALQEMYMW